MISPISSTVYKLYFDAFGSCVYLLKLDKNILIDTSSKDNKEELIADLRGVGLNPEDIDFVLLTHSHWDHNGNIDIFKNAKLYNKDNIENLKSEGLNDFRIIHTPGHTKDSICFLYKDILFSGDTIFEDGNIGRTDFKESQPEKMQESLDKLKKIKYNILCAGHDC
jgi:hydroxyacylglutathione hydrolase